MIQYPICLRVITLRTTDKQILLLTLFVSIISISHRGVIVIVVVVYGSMIRFLSRVRIPIHTHVITRHFLRAQTTDTKPQANENRSFVAGIMS